MVVYNSQLGSKIRGMYHSQFGKVADELYVLKILKIPSLRRLNIFVCDGYRDV